MQNSCAKGNHAAYKRCIGKNKDFFLKLSSAILILLLIIQSYPVRASAANFQKDKIVLEVKDQSLKAILSEIGRQSSLQLAYPSEHVNRYPRVRLNKYTGTANEMLTEALKGTDLTFSIRANTIVVVLRVAQKNDLQKDRRVSGIVSDTKGLALPGVSVKVKDGKAFAVTGTDGRYSIMVPDEQAVLVFTYVGFETAEVGVKDQEQVNVVLKEDQNLLSEVVVIGYGSVRKEDLTGSVSQVNLAELTKAPVASVDQALAGRVAGVQVSVNEDGQPGGAMNIQIRGANSLTQSNSPLYVIDGFPIEGPQTASFNPEDIETLTILKDASATAIYGARGANGVIVITTKKGKEGKPRFSYSSSLGFNEITKTMDMLSPYEFVKYELERNPNAGVELGYFANGQDLESYRTLKGVDWQDKLFNSGATQIHNLALRGGTRQTKYSISGSFFDSKGVVVNTGYKRYQARVSLDQTISDKFKAGINVNYSNQLTFGQLVGRTSATSSTTISGYLLYSTWAYRPVSGNTAAYEEQLLDQGIDETVDFRINPVISAQNTLRERKLNNIIGNAFLTYDITKNLHLKVSGGLNGLFSRNDAFYNSQTVSGTPLRANNISGVNGSVDHGERLDFVNENTINWSKRFNSRHKVDLLGGFTLQGVNTSTYGFSAILVPNESLGINGLNQGTPLETISTTSYNRLSSYIARADYGYRSKYLLTATVRADGSSKFAPGNRWGYFPSGAFAWRMHKEKFLRGIKAISEAKLRISYGVTGNNRVSDFAYLPELNLPDLASYSFNNERFYGVNLTSLGNRQLKWESTEQLDLGYDLGLFKDRISLTVDLYRKNTNDLLLNANLPYTTGYNRVYKNIGKVRNEGLELTLNTVNVNSRSFSWRSNFNISFNKNKILALNEGETHLLSNISSFVSRMAEEPLYIAEVGKPAAMFYGLVWDGVYQYEDFVQNSAGIYVLRNDRPTNGDQRSAIRPGDIKYRDLNNDGVVDANDKTVLGSPLPIHTGGFSNTITFKGFDLNVLMQWSYGNKLMNANRLIFEGNITNIPSMNQFASWQERWTPENQSNTLFRAGGAGPQVMSSRTLEDGSYLRLKSVSLGYSIPANLLRRLGIGSLNFNVSTQNLLTWTKYSGLDPEVSIFNTVLTPGFDFSAYPNARTVVFGIKAGF
ncbi:TonB-dependent receptor [Pedobacter sp. SYSU D00535]|uniref:TonB-dependent receptor n=1 Tax=Pedobacter sp. SYSU D00535 TaxID=2810308 RepID=UPI001F61588F|nr:TonB-dependent receptor [Pedobacter sp. SYSU D00535]